MTIEVNEMYNEWLIPPLTVQLLLENAVKHNAVLKNNPLRIKTFTTENDRLAVSNSLHQKNSEAVSGKLGLNNISAKYKLMKQPDVQVIRTATEFIVKVPLIKNS